MFKKLDKVIVTAFMGPFFMTLFIAWFAFLIHFMIYKFKHFIGKGLETWVILDAVFHFSLIVLPMAIPLAMLISSLMTFGSLGEHSELTAIKSAGISLLRVLRPVALIALIVTLFAFYLNDRIFPYANLKAYSIYYDIKRKKPTLDFKEGAFYSGIPGFSIKVEKKGEDPRYLYDVMIYDHSKKQGNTTVITAETGQMYTFNDERYLALDLQNGFTTDEQSQMQVSYVGKREVARSAFDSMRFVFDMSSFFFDTTRESLFKSYPRMKTTGEMSGEIDSLRVRYVDLHNKPADIIQGFYFGKPAKPKEKPTHERQAEAERKAAKKTNASVEKPDIRMASADSARKTLTQRQRDSIRSSQHPLSRSWNKHGDVRFDTTKLLADSALFALDNERVVSAAISRANLIKGATLTNKAQKDRALERMREYLISIQFRYTLSFAVFVMFLIGAPLGAIIKKGGLGVPLLAAILLFAVFYMLTNTGKKLASQAVLPPEGIWAGNAALFAVGLFFLYQAYRDARVFETDLYLVWFDKVKRFFLSFKNKPNT